MGLIAILAACSPGADAGEAARAPEAPPLPRYDAPRLTTAPRIDGVIDEVEWGRAAWTPSFRTTTRAAPARNQARARLAWDETHLYVAFSAEDADVLVRAQKRDDPVWKDDAHELYLDPDGDGRGYVELQVGARGTLFDAAFSGGPRKNMDLGLTAGFVAAARVDGSAEAPGAAPGDRDRGWTSEWAVELSTLPEPGRAPRVGECWRMNLFNVGRDRGQRVDESAWSPPMQGDFHNLSRFGELCFSE